MNNNISPEKLMEAAREARKRAYAPYSGFTVGAALLCGDGEIICCANIENSAFSPTICAERGAVSRAVFEGKREFSALAVSGGRAGNDGKRCSPCGVCRQTLSEFCQSDMPVYLEGEDGIESYTLGSLLPLRFAIGEE